MATPVVVMPKNHVALFVVGSDVGVERKMALAFDEDHPLFWEEVPENAEEHPDLKAIFNLDSEGTTEEYAENRRTIGNRAFVAAQEAEGELRKLVKAEPGKETEFEEERAKIKTKIKLKLQEALTNYTDALNQPITNPQNASIYYSNRAAVYLHQKNYGKALHDCKEALKLNPLNVKAAYRAGTAALALHRVEEAMSFVKEGLTHEPADAQLQTLLRRGETLLQEKAAREAAARAEEEQLRQAGAFVGKVIAQRGLRMGPPLFDSQNSLAGNVFLDGETLHWPVMLIYEEFNQTDYIKEDQTFQEHLALMFAPENAPGWDIEKHYTLDALEVYVEMGMVAPLDSSPTPRKRLVRVRQTSTLGKVLSHREYIIPLFPIVYVVSTASPFRSEFLRRARE